VRGSGEAASIAAMVEAMRQRHGVDRDRVFVTGLSAGGAMAAVMLAAYPDLFAGGAIIAGLPYGCASNLSDAFECMAGPRLWRSRAAGGQGPRRLAPSRRLAAPLDLAGQRGPHRGPRQCRRPVAAMGRASTA
jgi:pimeloyl-ACP methyl ester carboxylesterase